MRYIRQNLVLHVLYTWKERKMKMRGIELIQFRFLDCVVHAFLSKTIVRKQGHYY